MEPLSIITTIAELAATGLSIADGLHHIANELASAEKEIHAYGKEVYTLAKLLEMVHAELMYSVSDSIDIAIFAGLIDVCSSVLDPFNKLQQTLSPLLQSFRVNRSKWRVLRDRIQWSFEKREELLFWRSMVNQQHTALNSALNVLLLNRYRNGSAQMKHVLESTVRSTTEELKTFIEKQPAMNETFLIKDSSGLPTPNRSIPTQESPQKSLDAVSIENVESESLEVSQHSNDLLFSHGSSHSINNDIPPASNDLAIIRQSTAMMSLDNSSETEIKEIDSAIHDCLNPDGGLSIRRIERNMIILASKLVEEGTEILQGSQQNLANLSAFRQQAVDTNDDDYMIGIVCMFPFELAAVRLMLDEKGANPFTPIALGDTTYLDGRIGSHRVVLTCLPHRGYNKDVELGVSRFYYNMLQSFRSMLFAISIGVASGVPTRKNDVRLGDVVIARPHSRGDAILYCDSEKQLRFERAAPLPNILLTAIAGLEATLLVTGNFMAELIENALIGVDDQLAQQFSFPGTQYDCLYKIDCHHAEMHEEAEVCQSCVLDCQISRQPRQNSYPQLHCGRIATCLEPVSKASFRNLLGSEYGVKCIESEGAGISCQLPVLPIRGIADYADNHDNTLWDEYAALAAAAYVKKLLLWLPQHSKGKA